MSAVLGEKALTWAMQYCTWDSHDARLAVKRGYISPMAFNMLLRAVITGDDAETLPLVVIDRSTFSGMLRHGRKAAILELEAAGLIRISGSSWLLSLDGEAQP